MNRIFAAVLTILTLLSRTAFGDEVRHVIFPGTMIGTWGESAEKCQAKDGSNVVIEAGKYGDALGSCAVRWIVVTGGAGGTTNYAAHALCTSAKDATKTETVDIIVRPQGADRALMGRAFNDLKSYQRCSAP